jgi:hypothetical protein
VGSVGEDTVIVYRWSTKARKYQEAGILKQRNPDGSISGFGQDQHPLALSGNGKLLAIGAYVSVPRLCFSSRRLGPVPGVVTMDYE